MAIKSQDNLKRFLALIAARSEYMKLNRILLDVYKGNLKCYIDKALSTQLTGQAYSQARQRIPPINVLRRIVQKQSKIYSQGVTRLVADGGQPEQDMLTWYQQNMRPDRGMALANSYFNLFKNCLIQPYLSEEKKPSIRIIPSDRFIPFSNSQSEDEKPSGIILEIGPRAMGAYRHRKQEKQVMVYMAIDKDEFVYFTEECQVVTPLFAPLNPEGINNYGRVPYVYVNRDPDNLLPTQDSDTLAMTLLIPILLTDINFAHMFQAFSIVYGINLSDQGIVYAPNAFWSFKTEPGSDQKPEIGTIQPKADISGGLELVASQFALWLNTRGIKPGDIGQVNGANFASGISKILDEMDTSEDRNEQIPFFSSAEAELFDLVFHHMHPEWIDDGMPFTGKFAEGARVVTNFAEQVPSVRRGAVVDEVIKEVGGGLTTKKRGMQRLNPQMTFDEIEALVNEIDLQNGTSSTALNGAQVASLLAITTAVGDGSLPPDSAKKLIMAAFGLSQELVDAIINPIKPGSIEPARPVGGFGGGGA